MNTDIYKQLAISSKKLINIISDHSINDNKITSEKVTAAINDYEKYKNDYDTFENNLDKDYQDNIKFHRINKSMAIEDYITQRTSLYDDYKDKNTNDTLRNLLQFQIKTIPNLKQINEDIKYENIYTKYANIRMLS